jgi:hypothetical protein
VEVTEPRWLSLIDLEDFGRADSPIHSIYASTSRNTVSGATSVKQFTQKSSCDAVQAEKFSTEFVVDLGLQGVASHTNTGIETERVSLLDYESNTEHVISTLFLRHHCHFTQKTTLQLATRKLKPPLTKGPARCRVSFCPLEESKFEVRSRLIS